jgi:hypothetical protein
MGKKRMVKETSESMLAFKPPIHRVAANSIGKNGPLRKELFKVSLPIAAARLKPNLIGDFLKKSEGFEGFSQLLI